MNKEALKILQRLAHGDELLDVRAPVEFHGGHFPHSTNLPLLNDDERAAVGTTYKQEGPDAALRLGHQLVAGERREERVLKWIHFLRDRPQAKICCFRGGLRSQLVQAELRRHGVDRELVPGGYKALRQCAIDQLSQLNRTFFVLAGLTGSGKTELLQLRPHVDLEAAAEHRGSAFGARGLRSPAQAVFENRLAVQLSLVNDPSTSVWIEDESRTIGPLVIPQRLFSLIQDAPMAVIESSRADRAQRLTCQYLSELFSSQDGLVPSESEVERIRQSLHQKLRLIQRRLGGLETQRMTALLDDSVREYAIHGRLSSFWTWVERLLEIYYDPMYQKHLDQHRHRIVFRGSADEWRTWSNLPRV